MSGDHAHAPGVLTEIDHVGIAVRDLDAAVEWYERMFGATVAHRERVESDGVEEALIKVADSYIQLLTPFTDTSPLAKFMERNGEGLHHVGYRVDDCASVLEDVKHAGAGRRRAPAHRQSRHHRRLPPPEDILRHAHRARAGALRESGPSGRVATP